MGATMASAIKTGRDAELGSFAMESSRRTSHKQCTQAEVVKRLMTGEQRPMRMQNARDRGLALAWNSLALFGSDMQPHLRSALKLQICAFDQIAFLLHAGGHGHGLCITTDTMALISMLFLGECDKLSLKAQEKRTSWSAVLPPTTAPHV